MTVFQELRPMGMKPFHVIRKPQLLDDALGDELVSSGIAGFTESEVLADSRGLRIT